MSRTTTHQLTPFLLPFTAVVLCVALCAACQPSSPPDHEPPDLSAVAQGPLKDPKAFREHLEKLQVLRSWKMAEFVELEGAELERVDNALKKTDTKIFETHTALRKDTRALRRALKKGAPQATIDELTENIVSNRRALHELKFQQFDAASQELSSEKKAKLLIFLPEFERKVRRALKKEARKDRDHNRRRGRKGRRGRRRGPPLD